MKKAIPAFISTQLKAVEQHLKEFKKDRNTEHLHQLRVDIKKVNAILDLINSTYHVKYDKKIVQKIFNKSGKIRELHLNGMLIKRLQGEPDSVVNELEKREIALEHILIKCIPGYLKRVKKFRKYTDYSIHLPSFKVIGKYLEKKLEKAQKRFDEHTRRSVHKARMKIKELLFVYAVLPVKIKNKLGIDVDFLNDLQAQLGDWHDYYAAIQFFEEEKLKPKDICMRVLYQQEAKLFDGLPSMYPGLPLTPPCLDAFVP